MVEKAKNADFVATKRIEILGPLLYYKENGFHSCSPYSSNLSKSCALRVTSVAACSIAVAAIKASGNFNEIL